MKLDIVYSGRAGQTILVLGQKLDEEGSPFEYIIIENPLPWRLGYVSKLTEMEADSTLRLSYFLPYLESTDKLADHDAYLEFASATYAELVKLHPEFPNNKLRQWIRNVDTKPERVQLYGLMLGMSGRLVDAKLLDDLIMNALRIDALKSQWARRDDIVAVFEIGDGDLEAISIDGLPVTDDDQLNRNVDHQIENTVNPKIKLQEGLIVGYILSRGVRALDRLDEQFVQAPDVGYDKRQLALSALSCVWINSKDRFARERLLKTIHGFLNHPETADTAISILSQSQDWSVQDRLIGMLDQPAFNGPDMRAAIATYLIASAKRNEKVSTPTAADIAEARKAKVSLERLRRLNAQSVTDIEE